MTKKQFFNTLWVVLAAIFMALLIRASVSQANSSLETYPPPYAAPISQGAYPPPESQAPYPPPGGGEEEPQPLPGEMPVSEAAITARDFVAVGGGIPQDKLSIEFDRLTEFPSLGKRFQVVTLVDIRPQGQVYKLWVDLSTGSILDDISPVLDAESKAYKSTYGNLSPELYQLLSEKNEDDLVSVAIWVSLPPGETMAKTQENAFAVLAAKYPEAQVALNRSGKPMDVEDPELAKRIEEEYFELIKAANVERTLQLANELVNRGFDVTSYEGLPSIVTTLSKWVIVELSERDEVNAIYLSNIKENPELDTAVPNTLAPEAWNRGITGSGVTIAILEPGNVDPGNTFLNQAATSRTAASGIQWHATLVASCAASFHDTYRGTAYGSTILSAGTDGTDIDTVAGLQWAFDQGSRIVNFSGGFQADNNINWTDRAFDYWARQGFRFITKSAGNSGVSISSPGKGWNVLTVGAYGDNDNLDWQDDQMWAYSSYINPSSPNNDREKPEVVAPGENITALEIGNVERTETGTSLAAPQVAGLSALLIDRDPSLGIWPEAMRAIIMASATHNIEGPSIIVIDQGDLKDGAGGINADLADQIALSRVYPTDICYSSCWRGESINNTSFPVGTDLIRYFYISENSLIRVAISWWANADTPANDYSFSRLDTDLDLRIKKPNGQYLTGVYSLSFDNNYEIIEFFTFEPGLYQVVIRKARASESSNYLGTALFIIPMPYTNYLPVALNNY